MYNVYRGSGNAKQFVAGPFVEQATADTVAQALSENDPGVTIHLMSQNNAAAKRTSVVVYEKSSISGRTANRGARSQDNDT